jgi:WD40 repeat protein
VVFAWRDSDDIRFYSLPGLSKTHLANKSKVTALALAPDNVTLTVGDEQGSIRFLHYPDGKAAMNPVQHKSPVVEMAYTPNGTRLAASYKDGTLNIWEPRITSASPYFSYHLKPAPTFAMGPGGRTLAIPQPDGVELIVINFKGDVYVVYPGERAAFSPDGKSLAVANGDTVQLYPGDTASLLELARARKRHTLTAAECQKYLGLDTCPVF